MINPNSEPRTLNPKLSALILAGGQSRRMGQDKALLLYFGVPMLTHICRVASCCTPLVYVVTPWPEKYGAILPLGCDFIREENRERYQGKSETSPRHFKQGSHGPLVGFAQGLNQVDTEWVLLLACDLPHLKEEQLLLWQKYITEVTEDVTAFLPLHPKGWEPLCGFYRRSCLSSVEAYLAQGGRSFQGWLAQETVEALPLTDEQILFNCNTPEDWQVAIQNPKSKDGFHSPTHR